MSVISKYVPCVRRVVGAGVAVVMPFEESSKANSDSGVYFYAVAKSVSDFGSFSFSDILPQ